MYAFAGRSDDGLLSEKSRYDLWRRQDGRQTYVVTLAGDPKGLNPDEITIAEILKTRGYATGIFGKWHLGNQRPFLPTRQGFDEFFGIPYSHNIGPFHPNWDFPPLALLEEERVIETDPDADYLTRRITERTVSFIGDHKDDPFFIYVPHPIPHNPLHVSPEFLKTVPDSVRALLAKENGSINYRARDLLYPQAISEIDWSVGQIVAALQKHGLQDNTMVLFTTDNGPGPRLASPGPLRGRKGTTFEGGMRVPTVVWWPGKIKAGSKSDELLTAMDLLPTFANLAGRLCLKTGSWTARTSGRCYPVNREPGVHTIAFIISTLTNSGPFDPAPGNIIGSWWTGIIAMLLRLRSTTWKPI